MGILSIATNEDLGNIFGITIASVLMYAFIGFLVDAKKFINEIAILISVLIVVIAMIITSF
jgi:hypothetical protein